MLCVASQGSVSGGSLIRPSVVVRFAPSHAWADRLADCVLLQPDYGASPGSHGGRPRSVLAVPVWVPAGRCGWNAADTAAPPRRGRRWRRTGPGRPCRQRAPLASLPVHPTDCHGGGAQSEFEARTDGVRDERLAKASTHSVLGPPSGAVGRDDHTRNNGAKVVED